MSDLEKVRAMSQTDKILAMLTMILYKMGTTKQELIDALIIYEQSQCKDLTTAERKE